MSVFSDLLNVYIRDKEIKISSLVKFCGTDRSTMYKIINGKRNPPSMELFHKIAVFLHLTPAEFQKLEEAWKITITGPEIYYRRKNVESFICTFPTPSAAAIPDYPLLQPEYDRNSSGEAALTSRQQINSCLHRMLLTEAGRISGHIGLLLQPDHEFLFSLLSSLKPSGTLDIRHILCISGKDCFIGSHELYNLKCLKKIFPLYMAGLAYSPKYFYDSIEAHYYNFNMLPCLILTSDSALMCSSDYQTGIFYDNQEIVRMLWKQYNSYYDKCGPLFQPVPMLPENSAEFFDILLNTTDRDNVALIQPEACLTPFITETILNEVFNHSLPGGEKILKAASQNFANNLRKLRLGQFLLYFTTEGLTHFARTGLMEEIPEVFYTPFSPSQRIQILQGVLSACQEGSYRILKKPLNHLPENLRLCVRDETCSLTFKDNTGRIILLNILESSFLDAFHDYLLHVDPTCFCSPQEASEFVSRTITALRMENR